MEDFGYLLRESNAAWLDGRGDGRFERYESFYRSERAQRLADFDLEAANEAYTKVATDTRPKWMSIVASPAFGRAAIALLAVHIASRAVPALAMRVPMVTAGMLVAAFIGLRVFHRRQRRQR